MGAPFLRRTVTLKAGDVGKNIPGGFDWLCLDWAAVDAFTQQPLAIRRVNMALRQKPNDPFTNVGLFGIGDVLRLPWTEVVLSVPSITGNAGTEPTFSLDILAGLGDFHRDLIGRSSNESCFTPRGWFPVSGINTQQVIGIAGGTAVLAANNKSGVRVFNIFSTACGDGANDGLVMVSVGGVNVFWHSVDKSVGPTSLAYPEFDAPAGVAIGYTTTSAKDRLSFCWKLL